MNATNAFILKSLSFLVKESVPEFFAIIIINGFDSFTMIIAIGYKNHYIHTPFERRCFIRPRQSRLVVQLLWASSSMSAAMTMVVLRWLMIISTFY